MHFSRVVLNNWRNFKELDLALEPRMFFVGPNACGKSNLLDVFRFCRDLVCAGGLCKTVMERGGVGQISSLSSRGRTDVSIAVEVRGTGKKLWRYELVLARTRKPGRPPVLTSERVLCDGKCLLQRPDKADTKDSRLLEQTHLEQLSCNSAFRELADFLAGVQQPRLTPQMVQLPALDTGEFWHHDPVEFSLLHHIATTPERVRNARLRKIEQALRLAVPEFKTLREGRNGCGRHRLEAVFESWLPRAGALGEDRFSEGTLRLIALLWAVLSGDGPLLLEEPELSLHPAVATRLAPMIWRLRATRPRQILISTHSSELLSDPGIGADEVALLKPSGAHGTQILRAADLEVVDMLLQSGMNLAEAVMPKTVPEKASHLAFPVNYDAASPASRG